MDERWHGVPVGLFVPCDINGGVSEMITRGCLGHLHVTFPRLTALSRSFQWFVIYAREWLQNND